VPMPSHGAATATPLPAQRARRPRRATKREHIAAGTTNAWSSQGAATTTPPTTCAICAESSHDDIVTTCAICASCVTRIERLNASTSWRAAPRGQPPRRHRGNLRVVRHPRQATEREHIAAGTKNARSSQGAAATTTSRRPARSVRRASPAPSDETRAHHGGHKESAELPGSSRHDDIVATCAICASCVTRVERLNANTSRWAAPRGQPPRHRGDLRVVRHPRQATEREHIAAGTKNARSNHGATTTTTCASCVTPPSDRTRAHRGGHEERAELPGSSRHDDIAATCVSCVARADQTQADLCTGAPFVTIM
jgi:hypothetical protein